MKHHLLTALAAGSLFALAWPQGDALAQSRAAADAAMEQLGFADNTGMNGHLTYGEASWSRGRYILSDVVMTFPEDGDDAENEDDEGTSFEVGSEFETGHLDRLIFDTPRIDEDGFVVFDGFAMENFRTEETDGEDFMRVVYFGASGMNANMARDFARLFSGEEDDVEPAWNDWAFESFRLEGLELESLEEGGRSRIVLDQFSVQNYSDVELGQFVISGFQLDGPGDSGPVTMRLDELTLTGFQTQAYAELMDALAAGGDEDAIMSAYYQSAMSPQMDMFDQFAMRGLLIDAEGVHIAMDNLTAQIQQRGSRYISSAAMDSLRLIPDATKEAGAQVAMALGMLGYDRLELSLASNGIYDESTGEVWTDGDNYVELQDGLRIEMSQRFSGYDTYFANLPEAMAQLEAAGDDEALQTQASLDLMRPIILNNMRISLTDLSLLERALEAGAAAQGITADELRIQAGAMIGMGMMSAPPEIPRPMLSQLSGALTNFINSGGTLTIEANPPEPLSFGTVFDQVQNGSFDYEMLGLSFTAEAP